VGSGPPSLDDVDPLLLSALRQLGHRYGPMGVALAAAQLTDVGVMWRILNECPETETKPSGLLEEHAVTVVASEEMRRELLRDRPPATGGSSWPWPSP
jgi:hypothetical protein